MASLAVWVAAMYSASAVDRVTSSCFLFGIVVVVVDRLIDVFILPLKQHVVNCWYEDIVLIKLDVSLNRYGSLSWPVNAMSMSALLIISNPAPNVRLSFQLGVGGIVNPNLRPPLMEVGQVGLVADKCFIWCHVIKCAC